MTKLGFKEWLVALLIFAVALTTRLHRLTTPLADWHSWRQSSVAAVSRGFADTGLNPLYPKQTDISSAQTGRDNPEGYFFTEFPLYEVVHASTVKLLPNLDLIPTGRLLSAIFSALTAVVVLVLGTVLFELLTGAFAGLTFALLPFAVYFGRTLLPEPLAILLATSALLFAVLYTKTHKWYWFYKSAITFALALLVKPFTIFFGLPIAYLLLADSRRLFGKETVTYALIALAPLLAWRVWISSYPEGIPHTNWMFNSDGIRLRPAWWRWLFGERLGVLILGVWGVVPFCFGLVRGTKTRLAKQLPSMSWVIPLWGIGLLAFLATFATANVRHDYYQTLLLPFVALIVGAGFAQMVKTAGGKAGAIFITLMMLGFAWYEVRGFYQINNPAIVAAGLAVDAVVPKDALVVAPYNKDMTFLYQTNRKGWPFVDGTLDALITKGASVYVSTNFADPTTQQVLENYAIIAQTSDYVIADLTQKQ